MNDLDRTKILNKFYLKLQDTLLKDKSLHGSSCFISLIKCNSNKRNQLLRESSINQLTINYSVAKILIKNGSLLKIEGGYEGDSLVLTAKSIWELDKKINGLTEQNLISYFEEKDFQISNISLKLNSKEKRVLLTLITMRCFDKISALDLTNKSKNEYWDEVYIKVNKLLIDYNLNKKSDLIDSYKKSTTIEHEIIRVNDLTKKTHQLFRYISQKVYVVDVFTNDTIEEQKLQYLFKLLFSDQKISAECSFKLHTELLAITQNYAPKLKKSSKFTDVSTDDIIFRSIKSAVLNRVRHK